MPTGYYLTKRQRKDSIMQTGIHSIHPSGIVLQVKPEPDSPNAETQRTSLLQAMNKIANIMAKLHNCNCADVLTELVGFEVKYDEKDVAKITDNHILLHLTEIPADKVKYVGDFTELNAENA